MKIIDKIKLVETLIDRIEKEGVERLSNEDANKYTDLKNWFNIQAKKLRYI